jgi:peptidyl-prolyl cis-trans isomerase SurA
LAGGFLAASTPALAARKVVERIIARVNNEVITQRKYEREIERLRSQLAQQYSGTELEVKVREASKDVLRDLIDQALMVQKAKDLDINAETDLIRRLDEIRRSVKLDTLEDLQREVEKQAMVWEDFKDDLRRNLLMREVIQREVGRSIIISREESRKFFEEHKKQFESPGGVHLAQILISKENRKPEEAEKRAQEALQELKAGARWKDVAEKYSDDSTAKEGGDIGWLKEGTVASVIQNAIAKLELNEFTEILDTKYGYLILKVLERRSPGVPEFAEVEQRVNEIMYSQRMQPALREYLANLRKESYIYLAPGFVDTGAERPSDAVLAKKGP